MTDGGDRKAVAGVELDAQDPLAVAASAAVRAGDVAGLRALLDAHPGLAGARIADAESSRTLLHVVTDWPGHRPNGPETVSALVAAGADVNGRFAGPHTETPLHWAASCDDVAVLDTLLDLGADLEAGGSVIDGGSALADAVAFAQWNAARRLVGRGARTTLWQAAALGQHDRVAAHFAPEAAVPPDDETVVPPDDGAVAPPDAEAVAPPDAEAVVPPEKDAVVRRPDAEEVNAALWCACHGGQREVAAYLLERGGDPNWIGFDELTALDAAHRSGHPALVAWLRTRGARSATEATAAAEDGPTESEDTP